MSYYCYKCRKIVYSELCPFCGERTVPKDEALKKEVGGIFKSLLSIAVAIVLGLIIWWAYF